MKIQLILIGLFIFLSCTQRKEEKKDIILGHWTHLKTTDLRSKSEKSKDFKINYSNSLTDEFPDLILMENGILEKKHKTGLIENGIWKIENDSLKLSIEVKFEDEEQAMSNPVIKANIRFELNGRKYMYAGDYPIKQLERETIELGNRMLFDTYKKIK